MYTYCICNTTGEDGRFLIKCNGKCKDWFHPECLYRNMTEEDTVEMGYFYCINCSDILPKVKTEPEAQKPVDAIVDSVSPAESIVEAKPKRTIESVNYSEDVELNHELKWTRLLASKSIPLHSFKYMLGNQVSIEWAMSTGFKEPVIILEPDGLQMQMPSDLTVRSVSEICGLERLVEVLHASSQSDLTMTLAAWADYYELLPSNRQKILNVISLEISNTPLCQKIIRPKLVRDLDWVDNVWPNSIKTVEFPKVQLYCLMSVKNSYTDFHIDFGGTSVFYHILKGEKIFYFIRPTKRNLYKYKLWSSSPNQGERFFADEVSDCVQVLLKAGNTMFIPTGWIHAVFTPQDSLVIGGNFLHGLNIGGQLEIYDIEIQTSVPQKFRFPFYEKMQWYAAQAYSDMIISDVSLTIYELAGLTLLGNFLVSMAKRVEYARKRKYIPEELKDPMSFAQSFQTDVSKAVEFYRKLKGEENLEENFLQHPVHPLSDDEDAQNNLKPESKEYQSIFATFDPEFNEVEVVEEQSDDESDFKSQGYVSDDPSVGSVASEVLPDIPEENYKIEINPIIKKSKIMAPTIRPKKKKGVFARLKSAIRNMKHK